MRVPIPIAILCCLTAVGLTWYFSTRHMDFTTVPTAEKLTQVKEKWEESRPNIPPPQPINAELLADKPAIVPQTPDQPTSEQGNTLSLGNLAHAPGLDEYGVYSDEDTQKLIALATELETKGALQRALLAWERILDLSHPDEAQQKTAATAVKRLKDNLPPWNPDPTASIHLTLQAGAAIKDKKLLESSLKQAADLITESSGQIIVVDIKATIGKGSSVKTPRIPVAIWFSRHGNHAGETPPISFMTDPKKPKKLTKQIYAGAYALLKSQLARETQFSPLPEASKTNPTEELLRYYVTRFMWREFALSLKE